MFFGFLSTFFADNSIDMDKMVSIKGLVIRTTPVIPDMKTGKRCCIFA